MSVLLGRNGITPWIEEAAHTAVSTDWRAINESSLNANKRLFQRPRPAKVVQVVACCWPTQNVIQQSSTSTTKDQCNISCFPYLVLHDGFTSVNAILSEMVQARLFSSMPEEADAGQIQNYLKAQMARKPGSIVRISGWSFSTVDVCLGKRYFQCQEQNPHHQLSWPLALLIEDSVELIGAEGTGQTVDRPRDVNESLRILSVLITFSHWDLYLRLAMSYSFFRNELLIPVQHNNYFLPDRRGHFSAPDVLSILEFIPKFHEIYREDDQKRSAAINNRLSDNWREQYGVQCTSNRRNCDMRSDRAQFRSKDQYSREITTNGQQNTLRRFSYETRNETSRITKGPTKQSITREQSSPHSHVGNSDDAALYLGPQFDTQPENLKWISAAVTADIMYLKPCSEETEEFCQEQEFDTQLHHIHQLQSNDEFFHLDYSEPADKARPSWEAKNCNQASMEFESAMELQLDTQSPQCSVLFFNKSSCRVNLKTCDLSSEEAQLDTQLPVSSSLLAAEAKEQGRNAWNLYKRKSSVEA